MTLVTDRFPNIPAAGKRIPLGDRVKTCLELSPRSITPPVVKKFLNATRPEVGAIRVFYGKSNDPDIASTKTHGVISKTSFTGGSLINPAPKTQFQQKLQQLDEALYATHKRAPLGRSHDQRFGLPKWFSNQTTFGVKNHICANKISSHDIINPPKTTEQVERDYQEGHDYYVRSHNAYFVGERINRAYNWRNCGEDIRFGVPTPHHNDGRNISRILDWPCDKKHNNAMIVSRQCDEFRERTQPQLGKVHNKIADGLKLPADHTFGVLLKPDEFDARDLIHSSPPSSYLRGKDRQQTLVSVVRQHLKKANYRNFNSLLQAFRHYDKKGQGWIEKEDLLEVCREFNLDLSGPVLDSLMDYCDIDKDGHISFLEFSNFLNWKDKMPINRLEEKILTKERKVRTAPASMQREGGQVSEAEPLVSPKDLEALEVGSWLKTPKTLPHPRGPPDEFATSSSQIGAVVGGASTAKMPAHGVPTVRLDLPAPRIRRVSDRTNYGDQATAYDLLYPPLHSLWGVHEEHFFSARSKDEMSAIFRNAGVNVSEKAFEEAWRLTSTRHPDGEVCVESFRNALREIQAH